MTLSPSDRKPATGHSTIKEWPEDDRPRERLKGQGARSLSEAELLAILIRTGAKGITALDLARRLLSNGRSLHEIAQFAVGDFQEFGIGEARASAIVAAFELARRILVHGTGVQMSFNAPEDVAKTFGPRLKDLQQEEFWILLLNAANKSIGQRMVTRGTLTSSLVHPRECFHEAIKQRAASVIFIHNHPSGNPEPSQEDIVITKQLVESGRVLGIPVHDHIIVAGNGFTSMAERKLL
ncbi:MAG: DNA repair protein RadC [Ignavibacteriales bacterium]|nr:DNA repair protein RadC [Ignavibacteriales bacterium]